MVERESMKTKLILKQCALLVLIMCASCDRSHNGRATDRRPSYSRTYSEQEVKQKLTLGMSRESLTNTFGAPTFEDLQGEDIVLSYLSDDEKESGYRFTGFTVLTRTNTVIKWSPIYAGVRSAATKESTSSSPPVPNPTARAATHPLAFYVVRHQSFPGSTQIDTPEFPALGYISAGPQLQVTRLVSATWRDQGSQPTIEMTLTDDDAVALRKLTEESLNEKLLVASGNSLVEAIQVWEPIVTKTIRLSSTNQVRLQESFQRINSLVRSRN